MPLRAAPAVDNPLLERHAARLIQLRNWDAARAALHALARQRPGDPGRRAQLAYVRGQQAATAGDFAAARRAWRDALQLDPALADAHIALRTLPRPPAGWRRLWRRLTS
jgi:Flp pilus assembly protein TadD